MPMIAHFLQSAFAIDFFLQSSQRFVHRLAFFQSYFGQNSHFLSPYRLSVIGQALHGWLTCSPPARLSTPKITQKKLLDKAMTQLNEKDRNAIVLRFFEGKPLKEWGTSEDAAPNADRPRVGQIAGFLPPTRHHPRTIGRLRSTRSVLECGTQFRFPGRLSQPRPAALFVAEGE